jgi:hypothetical protein
VKVVQKTYKGTHGAFNDLGLTHEHSKSQMIHYPRYDPNNREGSTRTRYPTLTWDLPLMLATPPCDRQRSGDT